MEITQDHFDSYSFIIGVDIQTPRTISNQKAHFVHDTRPLPHQHIKGIGGNVTIQGQGKVKWNVEDYDGRVYTLEIRDTLYSSESPLYTLFPQHWDQKSSNDLPKRFRTYM